jgi:hypothetical protein
MEGQDQQWLPPRAGQEGPQFQPQPPVRPTTPGQATAALVLGIVAALQIFPPVTGTLAIVFGVLSRKRIAESGGRLQGAGMALAGILTGVAGLVIWLVFLVLVLTGVIDVDLS